MRHSSYSLYAPGQRIARSFTIRFLNHSLVCISVACIELIGFALCDSAQAQDIAKARESIKAGEFSVAASSVHGLGGTEADTVWQELAGAQSRSGAEAASWRTLDHIASDSRYADTANALYSQMRQSADYEGQPAPANLGGISMNDFRPLIDLIESSIAPDSWTSTQGEGTIRPYLSGVYVDAAGVLHRYRPDESGRLNQWLSEQSSWNTKASGLRRLSLVELERQCRSYAARNQPLPDELKYLGGIYDLQYLIVDDANQDLLIAGPAGPWRIDDEGAALNISSGRPVLRLDDLVQCLRCVMFEGGRFGCSITPRQENLAATQQFMNASKLQGQAWRDALQTALGQQDIEVFGIPAESTTAQVLVEADYRMKLIGMGLETTKAPVSSYLDRAMSMVGVEARPMDVARWWFTLNYEGIGANPDRTVFEFVGSGVKVMAETEFLNAQGERLHSGQSFGPTREFAEDFTESFDAIAEEYPIYNQLRNVFDLAIVCSVIKREGLAERVGWQPSFFAPASEAIGLRYRPQRVNVAREVSSVMNHETKTVRQGQRRVKHTLVGVSGGIECNATDWVNSIRYTPVTRELAVAAGDEGRRALLHDE